MCFYVQVSRPDPLVAKKDIICYKYGIVCLDFEEEEVFRSRFQGYYYRFGKETERVPLRKQYGFFPWDLEITRGYHSYSNKKTARYDATLCRQEITKVNQFRQDRGTGPSEDPSTIKVVQCIIPKGTTYYYNSKAHEYVSEQIIIQSIL